MRTFDTGYSAKTRSTGSAEESSAISISAFSGHRAGSVIRRGISTPPRIGHLSPILFRAEGTSSECLHPPYPPNSIPIRQG